MQLRLANDEDVAEWLAKRETKKPEIKQLMDICLKEEERPLRSVWDLVQAMTAKARTKGHQDARVDEELKAGRLLAKAA